MSADSTSLNGSANISTVLLAALRGSTDAERGEVVRTLGELLLRMTPTDRIETARAVGVEWIWDHMIVPVIQAEREGDRPGRITQQHQRRCPHGRRRLRLKTFRYVES